MQLRINFCKRGVVENGVEKNRTGPGNLNTIAINVFAGPSIANIFLNTPATTTQESKCGKSRNIMIPNFSRLPGSMSRMRVKTKGTAIRSIERRNPNTIVLSNTRDVPDSNLNKRRKLSSPFHGLNNPPANEKSLNARVIP
jgi:hypothetical protein